MKKFFVMIAAVAALSFTACTNNEGAATDAEATEVTAENFETQLDSLIVAGDTTAIQGLLAESQKKVDALIAAGDTVAAKTFVEKVKAIINTNKEKLVALAPSLTQGLDKVVDLPEAVKAIVNAGADSLKSATVEEVKNQVENVAGAKAEEVKAKAEEVKAKVEEGKAKVEEVKKTADDVKKAANDVKNAANALKELGKK